MGSCLENFYQALRSFHSLNPWLISLHASGVAQKTRELAVEAPVSRVSNRQGQGEESACTMSSSARLEKTSRPAEKDSLTRTLAERNRFYTTFQEPEQGCRAPHLWDPPATLRRWLFPRLRDLRSRNRIVVPCGNACFGKDPRQANVLRWRSGLVRAVPLQPADSAADSIDRLRGYISAPQTGSNDDGLVRNSVSIRTGSAGCCPGSN